eukprot:Nitzschia sp. Nitz4//scaffold267_size26297//1916//2834//NITZ4_008264-RA/size26297-augustus-gene-0.18-mRNA-1//-1//CDS//3329544890//9430//frame0
MTGDTKAAVHCMTHDHVTDEEKQAVQKMIESLSDEDVSSLPDDHMPLRHLRAEKGDVIKATQKLKDALKWRTEFEVDSIVKCLSGNPPNHMTPIVEKENETSKLYVRGYDKDGRALLYMRPARENTKETMDQMKHLVWNLEKAIACSSKNGRSKVCIVIDFVDYKLRDAPPLSASRYTLDILQKHYPERMHRAYICNPPFIFRTFWGIIRPFIDPVTKEKICFCHGKAGMEKIAADVGEVHASKYLETCAGGTTELRPVDSKEYLNLPFSMCYDEEAK